MFTISSICEAQAYCFVRTRLIANLVIVNS